MGITRFSKDMDGMEPDQYGEWVWFEDHLEIMDKLAAKAGAEIGQLESARLATQESLQLLTRAERAEAELAALKPDIA